MTKTLVPEFVCELPVFAASGLVIRDGKFFLVSDDEVSLVCGDSQGEFSVLPLWNETLPENSVERKKVKPDFESLYIDGETLVILPSFSRSHRSKGVRVLLNEGNVISHVLLDLKELRNRLEARIPDLNIEGAIKIGDEIHLFQRGNGKHGTNAVITLKNLHSDFRVKELKLPIMGNVPLTITDATFHHEKIWFLAVAEDTESTYLDGSIMGSFLGTMNLNFELLETIKLDFASKPEGLAFDDAEVLWLVTDDDSRGKYSRLYKLQI